MSGIGEHDLLFDATRERVVPPGTDVLVIPFSLKDRPEPIWVENTISIVKRLRALGAKVAFEGSDSEHPETVLRSLDIVLPTLIFVANVAAQLTVEQILQALWRWPHREAQDIEPHRVVIRVGLDKKGRVRWFEGDGTPEDVREGLRDFLNDEQ